MSIPCQGSLRTDRGIAAASSGLTGHRSLTGWTSGPSRYSHAAWASGKSGSHAARAGKRGAGPVACRRAWARSRRWCLLICASLCLPVLCRAGAQVITLDEAMLAYGKHASQVARFDCRFRAFVFVAEDEQAMKEGKGEVLGSVTGRLCRCDSDELLLVEFGDEFRMEPRMENGAVKSFLAPFPGPFMVLSSDSFVADSYFLTGTGRLGIRDDYFPRQLFNPLQALGVVGSEARSDPAWWLVNHPPEKPVEIEQGGSVVCIRSGPAGADGTMETCLDLDHGGAVCRYAIHGVSQSDFRVLEFRKDEGGVCFPLRACAAFANPGRFPKRCVYWSCLEFRPDCDRDSLLTMLQGSGITFSMERSTPDQRVWLPPNSVISPGLLGALRAAILRGNRDPIRWPVGNVWPSRLTPGLHQEGREDPSTARPEEGDSKPEPDDGG